MMVKKCGGNKAIYEPESDRKPRVAFMCTDFNCGSRG